MAFENPYVVLALIGFGLVAAAAAEVKTVSKKAGRGLKRLGKKVVGK